ncbi:hypothetical protein Sa4125_39300 [Aureimonas sp. SA4125]|uniref:DUF4258 domain-containing protein n=1 Tax=Aureimonas sp. SA4125 TaxID=2826993 RepID=UPI001CC7FD68|nr:DUF4258 domain-containing protein [Aureimonas sp. SA4125]BDA86388.1 hypothetical protein Sa4125_39300 [Aureimonas sp. SA4125]
MKPIRFTLHAQAKLSERRILSEWAEAVARHPEWVEPETRDPEAERRFGSISAFGGRILRVVCVETETTIRIITATFDRGARRP